MDTEPHDITTVSIRAFPPNPPERRTLQDYQADLVRRFGRVPSWAELAVRENRAMSRIKDRPQIEVSEKAKQMAAEARMAQGRETLRIIVGCITGTMTTADVIRVSGLTERQAEQALERAVDRGLLVKGKLKRMNVWERRQEAAE